MKRKLVTSSLLLAMAVASSSCSKIKQAEDNMTSMKDTTKTMSKTTDDMKKTTTEVKDISESMKNNMLVMHDQVRIKEARDTRFKEIEQLKSMQNEIAAKLEHAAVFYKSLEFQLWTTNKDLDSDEKRNTLFMDAVKEFVKTASELHGKIDLEKMSPLKLHNSNKKNKKARRKNNETAFYALAAAMHENNHYQEDLHSKDPSFELTSFYDLVKKAFLKEQKGEELLEHDHEILASKKLFSDLIQARIDMIAAIGIKELVDRDNMGFGKKLSALMFNISKGRAGKIKLGQKYSVANYSLKRDINKKLDAALKVKTFADEVGIEIKLDKTIHSILSNLELDIEVPMNEVQLLNELKDTINGLVDAQPSLVDEEA